MNNTCKIMIVDDEFIMRQGIKFMINWQENGYNVVGEASNGKEALSLIPNLQPDIILCDIAMPIINGLDFIKIVSHQYPYIKIIVLSGYDNFDYVRNSLLSGAVDYILKPTLTPDYILKILQRVVKTIPNLQIKQNTDKLNEIEKYFLYENIEKPDFKYTSFRIISFPINDLKDKQNSYCILKDKITTFLNNLECYYVNFKHNNRNCLVINYDTENNEKIFCQINSFIKDISQIYDDLFCVISENYISPENIKNILKNPKFFSLEKFYFKKHHLYLYDNTISKTNIEKFDYKKFSNFVNEKEYIKAKELLLSYIINSINVQIPSEKLKSQTKNFLYNFIGENDNNEIEQIYISGFDQIENSKYSDDFIKIVENIIEKLENILLNNKPATDEYMEKILQYIKSNYKEDLSLQIISERFNFGYSYLSAYFSQYTNECFTEYLNRIRIQKACELLTNCSYQISEVSQLVGYSDHSYFCRVFKKMIGVTPSIYRKDNL